MSCSSMIMTHIPQLAMICWHQLNNGTICRYANYAVSVYTSYLKLEKMFDTFLYVSQQLREYYFVHYLLVPGTLLPFSRGNISRELQCIFPYAILFQPLQHGLTHGIPSILHNWVSYKISNLQSTKAINLVVSSVLHNRSRRGRATHTQTHTHTHTQTPTHARTHGEIRK